MTESKNNSNGMSKVFQIVVVSAIVAIILKALSVTTVIVAVAFMVAGMGLAKRS